MPNTHQTLIANILSFESDKTLLKARLESDIWIGTIWFVWAVAIWYYLLFIAV